MNSQMVPLVLHTRVISGQGGGPEKTILNSPRFLEPLGYHGVCVYLRDPGDQKFDIIRKRAVEKRAKLVEVDDFGIKDIGVVKRMRVAVEQIVQQGSFQSSPLIWHGHDYKSNLLGLLLKKHFPGMRLVTTVHGWVQKTWKTPLYYAIDKWCLARYEQVICVSRDLFEDCQKLGVESSRLTLIDNAIALDDYEFEMAQSEAKTRLGFAPETKLVIAVGRLSDEKGFDLLIDAVAQLIKDGENVALAIAGDGAFRNALQNQIDELGLSEVIKLLGFVADPRVVYRAGDVYVLSSYREGLPNVVLEAMAMKVPVISTRIAGMPDLISDGNNGMLIETGSADAIGQALRQLAQSPNQRDSLANASRRTVEERFSFQSRMESIAKIYRQL
ncbi:glycosyltransferase [Stieleria sp. JC731]|uniref:glycosyltransferase n=1 Tax=Pirellulaceae TaxID=2691357 RepID=UPI001E4960B9|nr:glycosyltransferase [Stieleria sp. JC731]MCC9601473.1 glycosyltransferase [Stieleria sp. JC731]